MNPIYLWILLDILGLRRIKRVLPERRRSGWRLLGWAIALFPWSLLALLWAGWGWR